jgi:nucleoside-triphosphatase THEP1
MLILLSGPVGSGKTTLCQRLVNLAGRQGFQVGGVLTPAVVRDGIKVGIEAVNLSTGEVRRLSRNNRERARNTCAPGTTRVGQYVLDDRTLSWAAALCAEALAGANAAAPDSLVFVDEIGRLELDRGEGLARLIPLLAQPRDARVIVIVRDTLLDRFLERVRGTECRIVVVDPQCRENAWIEMTRLAFTGREGARSC